MGRACSCRDAERDARFMQAIRQAEAMAPVIKDYEGQDLRDGVTGAQVIEAMGGFSQ